MLLMRRAPSARAGSRPAPLRQGCRIQNPRFFGRQCSAPARPLNDTYRALIRGMRYCARRFDYPLGGEYQTQSGGGEV